MQAFGQRFLSIGLVLSLSVVGGCRTLKSDRTDDEGEATPPPAMKVPVGSIHLVPAEGDFVLIRSTRYLQLEDGRALTAVNSEGIESAHLRATSARKGQFLTADIVSGIPGNGDQVLMDFIAPAPQAGAGAGAATGGADERQVLE